MPDFSQLFQQAMAQQSKSTALRDLGWMTLLLATGTLLATKYNAPHWVCLGFGIGAGLSIVLFLGMYLYFAFKNPDCLRSEKFTIHKMAIQHGYFGDDQSGMIKLAPKQVLELPAESQGQKERKDNQ